MKKCVSVIVPVYNVDRFLDDCIRSIINQQYNNLDIILVDDGSTDLSPEICKKYQKLDKRISYFRKTNGGLSDARNFGLEKAKGEYVLFVDSDDIILQNCIQTLFDAIDKTKSDIGVCNLKPFVGECDNDNQTLLPNKAKRKIYTNEEALKEMLLERKFGVSACGKLFPRKFFDDIKFPINRLYEDMATTYKLINKATKIVTVDKPMYLYRRRSNSITTSKFNDKKMDLFVSLDEFGEFITCNYPKLKKYYTYRKCDCAIEIIIDINYDPTFSTIENEMKNILVSNIKKVLINIDVSIKKKCKILLCLYSKTLFKRMCIK